MPSYKDRSRANTGKVTRASASRPQQHELSQLQFIDKRPDAILQREIADAIDASPNQIVQRQQITSLFCGAAPLQARTEDGSGRSLEDSARWKMEQDFSANFSRVHAHDDFCSDLLSRSLESHAFTTGQDIFLKSAFNPGTPHGQKLPAHELTHVVQRTSGRTPQAPIQRGGKDKRRRGKFVERRQIMYIAQTKPDGFTLNLKDLHLTNLADLKADPENVDVILKKFTNYCVAYNATQDSFGEEGLKKVIDHAYSHAGYVGGWKEQGKYYFDSVRVVASEYNAIVAAIKEQQDAYFDLDGHPVRVRDKRGGPIRSDLIKKLKSLGKKLTELGVDADAPVPKSETEASPYI